MNDINFNSFMVKLYYYWHMESDKKKGELPKNFNNLQSSLLAIFLMVFLDLHLVLNSLNIEYVQLEGLYGVTGS
jgi:hypothetical protein